MGLQFKPVVITLILMQATGSCFREAEQSTGRSAGDPWPEITSVHKPWTRWWWFGSDVDARNIGWQLEQYAAAGFGGVEITPIYGVVGRESQTIDFLSREWMEMLRITLDSATRRGLGVDMNLGTGWPFGGPQISTEEAAARLLFHHFVIKDPADLPVKIVPKDSAQVTLGATLEALMAWPSGGNPVNLTSRVTPDGRLDWDPGNDTWHLVAAFCGKTGQQVKRAAPGGEGFSMDHFSNHALDTYLSRFQQVFDSGMGIRSFFNDSYEVYNASWTPGFLNRFRELRGYDLREHLLAFTGSSRDQVDGETLARLKSDYRETLSEMLLENFTRPWTRWSHSWGALTRNQAHGSPGNLIDLYAAVDIPECEIFGHRNFNIPGLRANDDDTRNVEPNPMMLKLATSAAHLTHKTLISNETFTWVGEHFKVALSQCKPEVEEAFLAGINHVFFHGTPYSPREARWPGWLFYASVHFGPTNSNWSHISGLNSYITRCQSLLQSGQSDNEVLVYWPIYDLWHRPEGMEMQLSVHNIQEWLVYPGVEAMVQQGYSYDFISDDLLQDVQAEEGRLHSADGQVRHRVLVVPRCRFIPVRTLQKILDLARGGALVIFEELPEDVPGFHDLENRRDELHRMLSSMKFTDAGFGIREYGTGKGEILHTAELSQALGYAGIEGESITRSGLKFTRRTTGDGHLYYLVNHTANTIDTVVPLQYGGKHVLIMDPQDGTFGEARIEKGSGMQKVKIQLQPGRSLFLKCSDRKSHRSPGWPYEKQRFDPVPIEGTWSLRFVSGGPYLPQPVEFPEPVPWSNLTDSSMSLFSGSATYEVTFTWSPVPGREYILELGKVYESARVLLNGTDLGIFWSIPYERRVGAYLKEGENKLEIEVANLMANRIRAMDRAGQPWRIFHDINFVNIAYEPFDASSWEVQSSGLEGPVRLVPIEFH